MRKALSASLLALLFAASPLLFGQAASGTATIGGSVMDPSGATISGADVTVRNVDTNAGRSLKTNEAGLYEAVSLQPGDYEVKAAKAGFATLTRKGITVSVGQRAVGNMAMRIS